MLKAPPILINVKVILHFLRSKQMTRGPVYDDELLSDHSRKKIAFSFIALYIYNRWFERDCWSYARDCDISLLM